MVKDIVHYNVPSIEQPKSHGRPNADTVTCADVNSSLLIPQVSLDAEVADTRWIDVTVSLEVSGRLHEILWTMNGKTFNNS